MNQQQDNDLTIDQQAAFSLTWDLAKKLLDEDGFQSEEVGTGILIAAICCFRKSLTNAQIAKILHEYAEDYAFDRCKDMTTH